MEGERQEGVGLVGVFEGKVAISSCARLASDGMGESIRNKGGGVTIRTCVRMYVRPALIDRVPPLRLRCG